MADKEDIPSYDFSHKYRGYALIIVNKNFYDQNKTPDPQSKRKGAEKDLKKMKDMFKALDFKVEAYKDLSGDAMRSKIQRASQDNNFNNQSDCFALVISSHGEEVEEKKVHNNQGSAHVWRHCVLGSDKDKVYIDDVMSYFEDKNAKGLKGKPKLFFIQACRSRYGQEDKAFDYGTFIKVALQKKNNEHSSDDSVDNYMFDNLDGFEIEDIYKDLTDSVDEDDWNEDEKTGDECIDSYEHIFDSRGAPNSGYMPPSPDQQLEQLTHTQQPEGEQEFLNLSTPNLPKRDDKTSGQSNERIKNRKRGAGDLGTEGQVDAGRSADSGVIPPLPFDIVPIKCPQDCLIVYPAVSGAYAIRLTDLGSRLLDCMNKGKNLDRLVKGYNLMQYLTDVSRDMAAEEITFEPSDAEYGPEYAKKLKANMPFKVTMVTSHRLTRQVVFKPKTSKSILAAIVEWFKKLFL